MGLRSQKIPFLLNIILRIFAYIVNPTSVGGYLFSLNTIKTLRCKTTLKSTNREIISYRRLIHKRERFFDCLGLLLPEINVFETGYNRAEFNQKSVSDKIIVSLLILSIFESVTNL
jgi:hypothetical protein